MNVRFLFIGEGSSDAALVPHLETLCLRCGASEASGVPPDLSVLRRPPGHRLADKLRVALELEPEVDFLYVHRDADARKGEPRLEEVLGAARGVGWGQRCVPVVPVQALEAWLLLDELQIRAVAENPAGRVPLALPTSDRVDLVARPKERLRELLVAASELSGRRLKQFREDFPRHRRVLLSRLQPDLHLSKVPSWARIESDTRQVLERLRRERDEPPASG